MAAALEGGEWSEARPGRTLPRERPGTHFTKTGLSPGFVMYKGIPIAIVRLRHKKKTVRQYVLVVLEY